MKRIHAWGGVALIIVLGLPTAGMGQSTYVDPHERFALELPRGWTCSLNEFPPNSYKCETGTPIAFSEGGFHFSISVGQTVSLSFSPGASDLSREFDVAKQAAYSNYKDVAKEREEVDLKVNGKPARWGFYRGTSMVINIKQLYYIHCGAVLLSQGGLQFTSAETSALWANDVEKMFQSIREVLPAGMQLLQGALAAAAGSARASGRRAPAQFPQKLVTYEDLGGRYALDLPEVWKEERIGEDTTVFRGSGPEAVLVTLVPGETDKATMLLAALQQLKTIMPDASPQREPVDLEVNGRPARFGVYRGTIHAGESRVNCFGLLGSVILDEDEGGVHYISLVDEVKWPNWADGLERIFRSIRTVLPTLAAARRPGVPEGSEKAVQVPFWSLQGAQQEDEKGKQSRLPLVSANQETIQRRAAKEGPARWATPLGAAQVEEMWMVSPGTLLVALRKDDFDKDNLDYLLIDTTSGRVLWRYNRGKRKQAFFSLLSASDEVLLFNVEEQKPGGLENTLLALDAQSGSEKWAESYTSSGTVQFYVNQASPIVVVEKVEKRHVTLAAVNLSDGKTAWKKELRMAKRKEKDKSENAGGPWASAPLIESGDVFHFYGGVERLSGKDGGSRWLRSDLELDEECPAPQPDGEVLWVVDMRGVLNALDASTGATRWKVQLPNTVRYTNIHPDLEKIYIRGALAASSGTTAAAEYLLGAVRRNDGRVLWTQTLKEASVSNLIEANGRLYFGTLSSLVALDAETGRQVFTSKVTTASESFPIRIVGYPDKIVYIGELAVAALHPTTGKQIYAHQIRPISPAFTTASLSREAERIRRDSDELARLRGGKHAKGSGLSFPLGASAATQQLARFQDMASYHSTRAAELRRQASAAQTQADRGSLREMSKLESYQAASAIQGQILTMRVNAAFDRALASADFIFSMMDLAWAIREAEVRARIESEMKRYRLFSRSLLSSYLMGQVEDYVVRPNLKSLARDKQFVTLAVIHLPSGRRRDTYLSPSYLDYGQWNIVNFKDGVVYHDGVGMDPFLYRYSEPHTCSFLGKCQTVENLLTASPARIPQ